MIVNVCPSRIARATPEQVWRVLTTPERYGEWLQDAEVVEVRPPGSARPSQRIELSASWLGRHWSAVIEVGAIDPNRRWIELIAHLPFGIVNYEHVTVAELDDGRTRIGFN